MSDRFDRNIRFFGEEGQYKLRDTHVAVVGIGGLGTHVLQQLALLGVGELSIIDPEELDRTNLNRYVGVRHTDPIPGTAKVDIGERLVAEIDPNIKLHKYRVPLINADAFHAVLQADVVFGCLDTDGMRLVLNEVCAAYARPYFDLASDIVGAGEFGGRICAAIDGEGCLICRAVLDLREAQENLASPEERQDRDDIYGVKHVDLGNVGPSVVSINAIVASLAVTEFLLQVTGMRNANGLVVYRGHTGKVTISTDRPAPDCYYCKAIHGRGDAVDVQRYLR